MRFLYRPDGARIGWKRYGGDIGLLLIPGFGGDGSCWGDAFPRLLREQGIAPVIYDPRGLGESSGGSSVHSMPLYAEDAAAVAEAAGAPLAALGWSMGAGVAAELALARPDLVSALILCSGVPDHGSAARVPVLVIEGEEDPLIPPGSGAALASGTDGAVCKTLPGGHGLVYERPKELADLVASFIGPSKGRP